MIARVTGLFAFRRDGAEVRSIIRGGEGEGGENDLWFCDAHIEHNATLTDLFTCTQTNPHTHTHTHTHTYIQTQHQLHIAKAVCELPKMQESQLENPQF